MKLGLAAPSRPSNNERMQPVVYKGQNPYRLISVPVIKLVNSGVCQPMIIFRVKNYSDIRYVVIVVSDI